MPRSSTGACKLMHAASVAHFPTSSITVAWLYQRTLRGCPPRALNLEYLSTADAKSRMSEP